MLSSDLVKIIPDVSGARSSNRFGFQGDWAICEILERFANGENFVFLFDYHEDVVILSSEEVDFKADFYQIKTDTQGKSWNKSKLITGKKSKKKLPDGKTEVVERPSIMGKLYANKYNFQDGVKSLNLISNAKFSFSLKNGNKTDVMEMVCLVDLAPGDLNDFTDHIKVTYNLTHSCDFPKYTYFKVTDLSVNGSKTHTTGKIAEVLEQLFPATAISSKRIYQIISDDIKRKNDREKSYSNFQHLIREKGISSSEIQTIFDANIKLSSESKWTEINLELKTDGIYSFYDRKQLQDKYREIHLRMPFSSTLFQKANDQILNYYTENCKLMSFTMSIDHTFNNLVIQGLEEQSHDPYFVKAMIIYTIHG